MSEPLAQLEHDVLSLAARIRARRRPVRDVQAQVDKYLDEHPDASANAVVAEVGGRRQEVLRAVRNRRSRFPVGGNQREDAA